MNKALKLLVACILCLSIAVAFYLAGVIVFAMINEYKPAYQERITHNPSSLPDQIQVEELSLLIWNIGYAGLGKEMDFFYEGGKRVRPTEKQYETYLNGIKSFISSAGSNDLILLQETDFGSKRSYGLNQQEAIESVLLNFSSWEAINYNVKYIPIPFLNPMGKVKSGLVTFSKYQPREVFSIFSPGTYSWPKKLFMPRRCILVTRFKTGRGNDLVLLNLHNSAYDDADELRSEELNLIKSCADEEYRKGNYVIAGGDWNQNPPNLKMKETNPYLVKFIQPIKQDFFPDGWKWAFDKNLPTNRDVDKPFDKSSSLCSLIDFYLVSPNVKILAVYTTDLGFENSDHLPVSLKVKLE